MTSRHATSAPTPDRLPDAARRSRRDARLAGATCVAAAVCVDCRCGGDRAGQRARQLGWSARVHPADGRGVRPRPGWSPARAAASGTTGWLMIAAGFALFATTLVASSRPLPFTIGLAVERSPGGAARAPRARVPRRPSALGTRAAPRLGRVRERDGDADRDADVHGHREHRGVSVPGEPPLRRRCGHHALGPDDRGGVPGLRGRRRRGARAGATLARGVRARAACVAADPGRRRRRGGRCWAPRGSSRRRRTPRCRCRCRRPRERRSRWFPSPT